MIVVFIVVLFNASCVNPARIDGPYEGKIVDVNTREPIKGVVVLAVWNKSLVTAAGSTHTYHDAEETITDEKGEFRIQGKGLLIMSSIDPINILIFKAGYEYVGMVPWYSLESWQEIKWEGKKAIIPLRKLTMEERRKRLFGKENIPDENQRLFIRELNKERLELGLTPYQEVK